MYRDILIQAGLTNDQAIMYEAFLKNGVMPASKAALKAGIKRGLGYRIIEQLVAIDLLEKIDRKVAVFAPNHPSKLTDFLHTKENVIKTSEAALQGVLGSMVSDYNLTTGKPNVRFFEGFDGVRKVLEDSLQSKEEILSYADILVINKYISDINGWYVAQREKKNIKKRAILIDSPEARKILAGYHRAITDNRLLKLETPLFESIMQIYDGKVSYITLSDDQMIGIIVEDRAVYEMHKALFNVTWSKAEQI